MTPKKLPLLHRLPRLSGWLLITILLMVSVWAIAPHQLAVSLYKFSLVSLAAVVGYWLDRSLFPYARPDEFLGPDVEDALPEAEPDGDLVFGTSMQDRTSLVLMGIAMVRRAIIVGCAMLAMGLGA